MILNSTISRSVHTGHILDFVTFMFSFIIFHKMRHIYSLCMQNTMGLFGLEWRTEHTRNSHIVSIKNSLENWKKTKWRRMTEEKYCMETIQNFVLGVLFECFKCACVRLNMQINEFEGGLERRHNKCKHLIQMAGKKNNNKLFIQNSMRISFEMTTSYRIQLYGHVYSVFSRCTSYTL